MIKDNGLRKKFKLFKGKNDIIDLVCSQKGEDQKITLRMTELIHREFNKILKIILKGNYNMIISPVKMKITGYIIDEFVRLTLRFIIHADVKNENIKLIDE